MNNQKHDVEALVRFEFARLAREVLGLRCVARLVDGISGDAPGTWFDIQSAVRACSTETVVCKRR
jgi:hypothetical protein